MNTIWKWWNDKWNVIAVVCFIWLFIPAVWLPNLVNIVMVLLTFLVLIMPAVAYLLTTNT